MSRGGGGPLNKNLSTRKTETFEHFLLTNKKNIGKHKLFLITIPDGKSFDQATYTVR